MEGRLVSLSPSKVSPMCAYSKMNGCMDKLCADLSVRCWVEDSEGHLAGPWCHTPHSPIQDEIRRQKHKVGELIALARITCHSR